jgi:hypothetical protein
MVGFNLLCIIEEEERSFEDRSKVWMATPNKTAADYRAAGYID